MSTLYSGLRQVELGYSSMGTHRVNNIGLRWLKRLIIALSNRYNLNDNYSNFNMIRNSDRISSCILNIKKMGVRSCNGYEDHK